MIKINENKTLKELRDKGFIFGLLELLYNIRNGIYLAFDLNEKCEDYLCYIGEQCFIMCNPGDYENDRKEAMSKLKESGFVIDE